MGTDGQISALSSQTPRNSIYHTSQLYISVKKKSELGLDESMMSSISSMAQESDSEEEVLHEFIPTPQPSALSTLAQAAGKDSEDDHTPGLLTPDNMSQGPSRDHSDNGYFTNIFKF